MMRAPLTADERLSMFRNLVFGLHGLGQLTDIPQVDLRLNLVRDIGPGTERRRLVAGLVNETAVATVAAQGDEMAVKVMEGLDLARQDLADAFGPDAEVWGNESFRHPSARFDDGSGLIEIAGDPLDDAVGPSAPRWAACMALTRMPPEGLEKMESAWRLEGIRARFAYALDPMSQARARLVLIEKAKIEEARVGGARVPSPALEQIQVALELVSAPPTEGQTLTGVDLAVFVMGDDPEKTRLAAETAMEIAAKEGVRLVALGVPVAATLWEGQESRRVMRPLHTLTAPLARLVGLEERFVDVRCLLEGSADRPTILGVPVPAFLIEIGVVALVMAAAMLLDLGLGLALLGGLGLVSVLHVRLLRWSRMDPWWDLAWSWNVGKLEQASRRAVLGTRGRVLPLDEGEDGDEPPSGPARLPASPERKDGGAEGKGEAPTPSGPDGRVVDITAYAARRRTGDGP